jgi:hypothetical protein
LRLPFFRDLYPADPDAWVHHTRDNLEAFVNRDGVVRVAFFGGLDTLQRVEDPRRAGWIAGAGGFAGGPGGNEDASDPGSRKLEGLRGYPHSGIAWN